MNEMQLQAVTTVNGPLLILAGAGSGKTTVLVNRIACMIKYGDAYRSDRVYGLSPDSEEILRRYLDGDVSAAPAAAPLLSVGAPKPWQILAITFTNKAAKELRDRLIDLLGDEAGAEVRSGTFHATCVRILRREAEKIGFTSHFTIYDTDDSKRVIRDCQRELNIDDKFLPQKAILNEIGRAKDALIGPEEYASSDVTYDERKADIGRVYERYQALLRSADAMDFDDIIYHTVRLLQNDPDTLAYYQDRFRYIMVDEYQDTSHAQYVLVSLLAGAHRNLCVVGDDDQSIYSFRGATIENILSFERQFPHTEVIRLEENYRSTQTILDAANAVIANNTERKGKNLWTANGRGEKIELHTAADEQEEARFIADRVMDRSAEGESFSDFAVLYRTNAQSNNLERAMVRAGIPYRIIGGHRFYDRKEIRDAVAYLAVISNPNDNVRLRRIINELKRGIGETTLNNAAAIAAQLGESMFDVMREADSYAALSRAAGRLKLFTEMILSFSEARGRMPLAELFRLVINETGYLQTLDAEPDRKEDRLQNLDELYSTLQRYEDENGGGATLEGFLEEIALLSDIDSYEEGVDSVTLMTLHAAKGLEFPEVFIAGMENGLFPSQQALYDGAGLEEERRLAYVGITRAKRRLCLTNARSRMQYGKTVMNPPSDFVREIPAELLNDTSPGGGYAAGGFGGGYYGGSSYRGGSYRSRAAYPAAAGSAYPTSRARPGGRGASYPAAAPAGPVSRPLQSEAKKEAPPADLRPGDAVLHKKFGKGMVISVQPLGNDLLTEVAFESCGTKKLMAGVARLQKL